MHLLYHELYLLI